MPMLGALSRRDAGFSVSIATGLSFKSARIVRRIECTFQVVGLMCSFYWKFFTNILNIHIFKNDKCLLLWIKCFVDPPSAFLCCLQFHLLSDLFLPADVSIDPFCLLLNLLC